MIAAIQPTEAVIIVRDYIAALIDTGMDASVAVLRAADRFGITDQQSHWVAEMLPPAT